MRAPADIELPLETAAVEASAELVAPLFAGLLDDLQRLDAPARIGERLREAAGVAGLALVTSEPDGRTLVVAAAAGEPFASFTGRALPSSPAMPAGELARQLARRLDLAPDALHAQLLCDTPFCLALLPRDGRRPAALLSRIGREVALALAEARLAARVAADRRRATLMRDLARDIAQSLDPAHVWQTFQSRLRALLPGGTCLLVELPGDDAATLQAPSGPVRLELTAGGLVSRALASGRAAEAPDLPRSLEPGDRQLASVGLASAAAVPLVARAATAGLIVVGTSGPEPLSAEELALVEEAASHLAPALANARVYRDLADLHARLEQTSRAKETLSSLLVHDLRSPLTAALAGIDAAAGAAAPEGRAALEESRESLGTVIELISGLLEIARLQEGRMPCVRRPTALELLVTTAVRQVEAEARRREVTFLRELCGGTFPLDGQLVARALRNLLVNAVRASPAGASVEVRAARRDGRLVFEVVDAGPALPAEKREELFRKFSPAAPGGLDAHGLGLHFVRLAAEAHGGRAFADETPDGRARVVFELPDGR